MMSTDNRVAVRETKDRKDDEFEKIGWQTTPEENEKSDVCVIGWVAS
jgi:hypothetical protein